MSDKSKKHGRNSALCKVYKLSHKREQNKLIKLKRHLKRFPDDTVANKASDACKTILGIRITK